jgi:hypothetical protein
MGLRSTPPAIPPELLNRYGEPEHVFGPNVRVRVLVTLFGAAFFILGIYFLGTSFVKGNDALSKTVGRNFGSMLAVFGAAMVIITMRLKRNWVFVCSRGLVRTLGGAWEGVRWADVDRFEDATFSHKSITSQACRIVLTSGGTWGFMADHISQYPRLAEVLQQRLAATPEK